MKILLIANGGNHRVVDALYQTIAYLDSQGIDHVDIDVSDIPDASVPYSGKAIHEVDERLEKYGVTNGSILMLIQEQKK